LLVPLGELVDMRTAWRHECQRPSSVPLLIVVVVVAMVLFVLAPIGPVTAAPSYRPDALIRKASDAAWLGNNVYNTTGKHQTRSMTLRQGRTVDIEIRAQNDGAKDSFKVLGTGGTRQFPTTYWFKGDNVTKPVVEGKFSLRDVPARGARVLVARISVAPNATVGEVRTVRVLITSVGAPRMRDAVVARVQVRPQSVIDSYLAGLPSWKDFSPPVPKQAPTKVGDPVDSVEMVSGQRYECTTQTYSLADTPTKLVTFTPDSNILWLGSLLQGKGYKQGLGSLQELPIRQRTPLIVSLNLLTRDTTRTVEKPTVATVQQAIGHLISRAEARQIPVPTSVSFKQQELHSLDQAALGLGLSARYMTAEVKGSLDVESSVEQHTVTAYFVENAFTASMVLPQTPGALFSDAFTNQQLREQIGLGRIGPRNLPVFVDSITYGRVLVFSMTSTASSKDIRATLNAVYNSGAFGASASLTAEQKKMLNESEINVATIGGDNGHALALIRSGDLADYFAKPASLSTYRPISYTIRNLGDSSLAKVSDTLSYNVRTCELAPTAYEVTVRFDKAHARYLDDGWLDNTWELDRFFLWVKAMDRQSFGDPGRAAGLRGNDCTNTKTGWHGGICRSNSGYWSVEQGQDWQPADAKAGLWKMTLTYDNTGVKGRWPFATLQLHAEFRDYDSGSADDWARGTSMEFVGDDMLTNGQSKVLLTTTGDAQFEVYLTVTRKPIYGTG
jgi:hypothetical protein